MTRPQPKIAQLGPRLENFLFGNAWPFRLARALGIQPAVRTVRHSIAIGHGSVGLPPLKLAFASDFHAGPTTDPALLRVAFTELRAAAPDVLLLGGDFVTLALSEADWLFTELGEIPAPLGRFAVLGNHDWWSGPQPIVRRLEEAGIQVLTNRNVRLAPPFDRVWICGIDDHWCGSPDGAAALAGAEDIRVVLMHAPSGLLDMGRERFDLAVCGHTHGGQLALPGGIPITVPHGRLSRRYARGRFDLAEGGTLIVSVGVGCVGLPFRLFAKPEIVVCTLTTNSLGSEVREA
ncbi:MAG: metallophosphoesterase [Gemmatimonadales bacterium]